jgi:hypothetical protein
MVRTAIIVAIAAISIAIERPISIEGIALSAATSSVIKIKVNINKIKPILNFLSVRTLHPFLVL